MYAQLVDPEPSVSIFLASMYSLLASMQLKLYLTSPDRKLVRPSLLSFPFSPFLTLSRYMFVVLSLVSELGFTPVMAALTHPSLP